MPLIACDVIIPTVPGRTRLPWAPNKLPDWESATAYLLGGISPIALGVVGKWRNPAVSARKGIVPDPQNRYKIVVSDSRVDELREFLRFTCVHFEQECLYFTVAGNVEFPDNPLGWP